MMSKKKTEHTVYNTLCDFKFMPNEEATAVLRKNQLVEAYPPPARVRLRRLRNGWFRLWVRVPRVAKEA